MSGFLGMFTYGGAATVPSEYVAMGGFTPAQRLAVYQWTDALGFGTKYSIPSIPSELHEVSFVPDNSSFAASSWVAPYIAVWRWSSAGFGTQYGNPGSPLNPSAGGISGFNWTKNVDAMLVTNVSPTVAPQAWAWNNGFGSKYANGSSISTISARGTAISSDSAYFAAGLFGSPGIALYPWASGFGTRFSNPTSLPVGNVGAEGTISFNPITNDLAVGTASSPYIFVYPISSSGFGTKYADPSSLPSSAMNGLRYSSDGTAIATVNTGSPYVNAWAWSGGFGTKYSNPSTLPPADTYAVDFSSTSDSIITGRKTSSPFVTAYTWSGASGFGTKYSDPASAPGTTSTVAFSNQSR